MTTPITQRERELCRYMTSCIMMVHDEEMRERYFKGKSYDKVGEWVRGQLDELGFKSTPMGMTHIYLTEYTKGTT